MNLDELLIYMDKLKERYPLNNYKDIPVKFKTNQATKFIENKEYKIKSFKIHANWNYSTDDRKIVNQYNVGSLIFYPE